ncbi:anti-sigma-I factor RsgI family protein [Acetivibrio cellulolyticus]|uniref:anti-sigma-I factor RsgI family protein n=1 Tax=Acetivibrio cellulolyticus TaxID=35830 RepID=UPI0002481AE1|nr:anti-sigma factor domain-containing protein [Acetivibrio cellulolyticus]
MYNVGTIIELAQDGAIVMVSDCDFVLIRKKKGMFLGQQVKFSDSDIKNPNKGTIKRVSAIAGIAAALIMIFMAVFQFMQKSPIDRTYAFVDIDINPSLELLIDRNNSVVGIKEINKDAETLLEDNNLKGMPIDYAIEKVFELAHDRGFVYEDKENLVLISLALNPKAGKKGDEEQKLEELLAQIEVEANEDKIIKPVVITVPESTKKSADINDLSTGRQYIYEKSKEQSNEIDLVEAKESPIEDLLSEVKIVFEEDNASINGQSQIPTSQPTLVPTPKAVVTSTPAVSSSMSVAVKASTTPTATVAPKLTAKPTLKATPKPAAKSTASKLSYEYAKISGKADGGKIYLKWKPVSNSNGFKYYKVVASRSDVKPKYPENGYLYVITDVNSTSAVVDNSQSYTNGDFGSYFKNGEKYYFSITTVYEDRVVAGDVIVLTYPGESVGTNSSTSASSTLTPKVSATVKDGKVYLKWNPIYVEGFNYYKVVISKSNPRPKYPDDGYMYYTTNPDETSFTVDKSMPYNGGDFGGTLQSGQKYYFSITMVYNGNSVAGNAIQLTIP